MIMKICLAAGGTGGHLIPGLAAGKALRARGHEVHFILKKDAASQAMVAREGFASSAFAFSGLPRRFAWSAAAYPLTAAVALAAARRVLRRENPTVVLGMGGYVSVPVGLWAVLRRIPLVLHEQNRRAGLANRLLSRWARAVGTTFAKTTGLAPTRAVATGLPLRPDLSPQNPKDARRALGLDPEDFTFLVFGGSQGARALNRLVIEALPALGREGGRCQFIHLSGPADEAAVRAAYDRADRRAFVKSYWPDMAAAYSAADTVVCRSGANTVMELWRMGKSALLVPYPFATDDHQAANAAALEEAGLATVILEKDLTPARLAEYLNACPPAEGLRRETAARLVRLPKDFTRAADRLADLVEACAGI